MPLLSRNSAIAKFPMVRLVDRPCMMSVRNTGALGSATVILMARMPLARKAYLTSTAVQATSSTSKFSFEHAAARREHTPVRVGGLADRPHDAHGLAARDLVALRIAVLVVESIDTTEDSRWAPRRWRSGTLTITSTK